MLAAAIVSDSALPTTAQPRTLTLGTAQVGGTYFIYGGVVASLLSEKLGIHVSTQQTQGPNQNIILIDAGRIDLGMTTLGVALQAWTGRGPWTRGKTFTGIRALFPMYDTPFHFVTTAKSTVRSVADLHGKTVGVGPKASTPGTYYPLILQALGISATIRNGSASDMAGQLGDGLIDAFAFAAGLPVAAFSELEAQRPVRFFTFTDAQIAALKKAMPELGDAVVPRGTYRTLSEDHRTVGLYNFFIGREDLPEDLAYRITRTVLENNAALVKGHSAARETVLRNWSKNTFLPFHPGSVRYYREKGITIPANLR
jgi:TRAP transporter TAXI family solute receptor